MHVNPEEDVSRGFAVSSYLISKYGHKEELSDYDNLIEKSIYMDYNCSKNV